MMDMYGLAVVHFVEQGRRKRERLGIYEPDPFGVAEGRMNARPPGHRTLRLWSGAKSAISNVLALFRRGRRGEAPA